MQVIVPGHLYLLKNFEDDTTQPLQFIHKEPHPENPTNLMTVQNGTTNEELLAVLINRMKGLNDKFPCRQNALAITKLEEALFWLNNRTEERKARNVEGKHVA